MKALRTALLVASATTASAASAATLDLTENGFGNQGSQVVLTEATVDLISGDYLNIGDFVTNTACTISAGLGCVGSFSVTWNFDVKDVSFDFGYGNAGDTATVSAFDELNNPVDAITLTLTSGTGSQDISSFGTFRSLIFDTVGSTGAGYAFGNINFEKAAAVPLPANGLLLLAGLGGLAHLRRRKT